MNEKKEAKIPKEVRRNMQRQQGLQGIVESITGCIRRGVTITITRKSCTINNICDTIDDVSKNILSLVRAESDYVEYDKYKRERKQKKLEKKEPTIKMANKI